MNERIRKLAEQATKVFEPNDPDYRYESFDKNKFAELIIQECIGVTEEYRGTEWGKAAECIGDRIKDHFGVEE